jgi:multicomponent K+:H+ antiporter subunit E
MRRVLPYPLLTAWLLCMWLVLNDSLDPAHITLGVLVGIVGGLVYARIEPSPARAGKVARPAAALVWLVLLDIIRSNVAVLRITARIGASGRVAGFLPIPLELRDRRGLAVLACIVTATPGTSWAGYDAAADVLTLHVLDLVDQDAWVRQFKERYEKPLMEIFP